MIIVSCESQVNLPQKSLKLRTKRIQISRSVNHKFCMDAICTAGCAASVSCQIHLLDIFSVKHKTNVEKFSEIKFTMTRLYLDRTLVNWLYC